MPGDEVDPFVAAAAQGVLAIQRCGECGTWRNPPSPMCGRCGSLRAAYEPVSGRGRLVSWIESRHPSRPDEPPRTIALVELDEGVRLVSNLVDAPSTVDGMALVVAFRDVDGVVLPVFRPEAAR